MNYDCEGCKNFIKVMVKVDLDETVASSIPDGISKICIDMPICTYSFNCLAIRRCDFFEPSDALKETRGMM